MSLHDRLFRALMRVLPSEFRGDYGREMESHFRESTREAGGGVGLARLWLATLGDIARTAPAEHWDVLVRDLSYACRMLARRPALTAAALVTLTLGIGANTAIFSVVNGVLLAPLPYPDADRVVLVKEVRRGGPSETTGYYSFDALRSRQQSFEWISAMGDWSAILTAPGQEAERLNGARVTWEYFNTLGIKPAIGRGFDQSEDHPARRRVVLLGDSLWRKRFNADPSVVGRVITLNGAAHMVAGVMPPSMNELISDRLLAGADLWTLLGYAPDLPPACRGCRHLFVVGRIRDGVTMAQAEADASRVYQSLAQEFPRDYVNAGAALTPVRERFLGPVRPVIALLWAAVGLLLLMACANIANLLLIRASEREEEIAIRQALGVSPARLLRQFLTESVLLAFIGGLAGTLLAVWATRALAANGPAAIPRLENVTVDGWVWLYAIGTSLVTGLLFGLAPARLLITRGWTRLQPGTPMLRSTTRTTAGPAAWRQRAALIGVNVALSTVLLIGCGLLVRSFVRLLAVEPGFNPHGILTMEVETSGPNLNTVPGIAAFYDELIARVAALPGVMAVGASTQLPLSGAVDRWSVSIEGRRLDNPSADPPADRYGVAADYFASMNIPLVRGRLLNAGDGVGAPPVVVIGQTMAAQLWPGEDPIGRRITLAGGPNNPPRTIVGIVGDVRHGGLHEPVSLQAYMPQAQAPWPQGMTLTIRVARGQDPLTVAGAAREQVRALDPRQPVTKMQTYDAIVASSIATREFTLVLIGIFAGTALLLAVVGLYGALSYVVSQRQREIGVRVALGAGAPQIRRLVLSQGLRPTIAGLALGLPGAILAGRAIEAQLFGVTSTDALTYAVVFAVVATSAVAACLLPARRAARIEPAVTLRAP